MKRLLFLVALSLVAMLIFASVAGAQKQATRTVMIQNFSFKPAHITIKRGTKVTWINKDSTTHTVTANNGRSFDSRTEVYTHLQECREEEVPLRDTSRYEGKRRRQALAVDEGKRPFQLKKGLPLRLPRTP